MLKKGVILSLIFALTCGQYYYDFDTYEPGRQYENGDRVRVDKEVYECRRPPYNRLCHKDIFNPMGSQRDKAWMRVTETTIEAEDKDFILPQYTRYYAYKKNELVQFRGHAYKCLSPNLCGNAETLPGTNLANDVWLDVTVQYEPGKNCRGSSLINNAKHSNISPYQAMRRYSLGDRVILDDRLYQCESYPNGNLCNRKAYNPGSAKGGIAWQDITCKDLSHEQIESTLNVYSRKRIYKEGSKVSWRGIEYQCIQDDWCNLENYHPGVGEAGAWIQLISSKCPKAAPFILAETSK